ncbi:MAG: hypothetical protein RMJ31_04160 [Nitrososphaerota archaeon]|nr:hypothetical protein [Nitrososphaerales archaeon]MDW8044948.1 hypothetical protein [Nitrososphaerota archaeon]
MNSNEVKEHYSSELVQSEITRYAKGRWVGIYCLRGLDGIPTLFRYSKGKRPLKIECREDMLKIFEDYATFLPRTIYATANIYKHLTDYDDLRDLSNIISCTATWDIDNTLDKWEATIEVVKSILSFLRDEGIEDSIIVKWSGEGCHVHLHQNAISLNSSPETHPLDLAYSIVEYVRMKLQGSIMNIALKYNAINLKVENNIDPQRLFTCPLSLHRALDVVCICIPPDSLSDFTPEWIRLRTFKHYRGWDRFKLGEANRLAEKAYKLIGPRSTYRRSIRRKHMPLDKQIMKWLEKGQDHR